MRTTISLDQQLADAADEAVRRGEAASVSAFVSEAIAARVAHLVVTLGRDVEIIRV